MGTEMSRSSSVTVSFEEFKNAVILNGGPEPSKEQYFYFSKGFYTLGGITSKEEAAMCLAQFINETTGLTEIEERGFHGSTGNNAYSKPEHDAPGRSYHGRGYIQLTGWANYHAASMAIYKSDLLWRYPDLVHQNEEIAWRTAFYFWKTNVHDRAGVSKGKFGATTNAINGTLECNDGKNSHIVNIRFEKYGKVRKAFNLPGSGDPTGC